MGTLLKVILAIILPPLGAVLQVGLTMHFWINILLTILGWLPGVIHALWLIFSNKHEAHTHGTHATATH